MHIEFQKHLNTHETLKAKQNVELMARDSGVIPQSYLSDNGGSFTSAKFTEHLGTLKQVVKFAGVGAHHHNGHAERAIQTIMSIARTMMLHSAVHWPDVADATLWPMAVSHAIFLHNHVPDLSTGLCPSDVFTKSRWEQRKYHDLHVLGCPVYALEKTISSAFVQANLTDPVWIHMPRGFKSDQPSDQRTCLRLVKSLYGLSVTPRLWYQHICKALPLQGLKQSATDSCLLYSKTIMIVLYVNDLGMLPLKNPLLITTKSATSNAYNATKFVLHVSAYFQYVSHTAPCKYNHVATVVAGPNSPATGAFVSQLHCHFQWHEGSHVETHNMLVLRRKPARFNQNLD